MLTYVSDIMQMCVYMQGDMYHCKNSYFCIVVTWA